MNKLHIMNDNEIDRVCRYIVAAAGSGNTMFIPHIHFLYHYGVRLGEVFDNHIESIDDNENIHIQPQKNNKKRIIPVVNGMSENYLLLLKLQAGVQTNNYKNLQRHLRELSPLRNIQKGSKNISAHIFRHNYVRKLHRAGLTVEQINENLGYNSETVAKNYLQSIIFYETL